jgi:hypothetical protein
VACVADELLEFALKRIERFEHVGTTEKLFPSVESAAAALKMPLGGTAYGAGEVRLHKALRPCRMTAALQLRICSWRLFCR